MADTTVDTTGQDLLQVADDCYNDRLASYHGFAFSQSVFQAMQQTVHKKGEPKVKHKLRKEDAVKTVTALFDHTRQQDAARLQIIASEATAPVATGTGNGAIGADDDPSELQLFAAEVAGSLAVTSDPSLFGVINIDVIITLIKNIIAAIAACKNPPVTPITPVTPVVPATT